MFYGHINFGQYCCAVQFDLSNVQTCYKNGDNSNPGSSAPSMPQDHYCVQILQHTRDAEHNFQVKTNKRGI